MSEISMGRHVAKPDTVHVAGSPTSNGSHWRQRCSWCGALLVDGHSAMPSPVMPPALWPPGGLVAVAGERRWMVGLCHDTDPPAECCVVLDPAVTR